MNAETSRDTFHFTQRRHLSKDAREVSVHVSRKVMISGKFFMVNFSMICYDLNTFILNSLN